MNNTKFCLFCENKGIKGPHNHTLRDFKNKEKPITCPELLSNTHMKLQTIGEWIISRGSPYH